MNTATISPAAGLDISQCDREPIHVPGSIQPHGSLLVIDAKDLIVVGGAGALDDDFGTDWMGKSVVQLLGVDAAGLLGQFGRTTASLGRVCGGRLEAIAHRSENFWLVELEPSDTTLEAAEVLGWIDEIGMAFERSSGLVELCERAAESFKALTGYDRVMIYRFLDDDSGVVIAEDVDPDLKATTTTISPPPTYRSRRARSTCATGCG